MSYDHRTTGWEEYEAYVRALRDSGISPEESEKSEIHDRVGIWNHMCDCGYGPAGENCEHCTAMCNCFQALRMASFTALDGSRKVVEEYLALRDEDCDGESRISIEVYEEGNRPDLQAQVLEA